MKKYFIIINPVSGGRNTNKKLKKVIKFLKRAGIDHEVFNTQQDVHADQIIKKFFNPAVFTDVLIIGGDGTINEAVNGFDLMTTPISIISSGTGNDTARSLLGTLNIKKQINIAIHGIETHVDIGRCNGRIFTNGLGIGFDGKVVESMNKKGKILKGPLAYYYTVIRLLARYKESKLTINIDGKKFERCVFLMTVAKGKSFGGGFLLNPDAKNNDGDFDICIINKIPVYKRFFYLPSMKTGGHKSLKEVEFFKCRECMIEANDQMVAHLDGEFIGNPPFQINIQPGALRIRKI